MKKFSFAILFICLASSFGAHALEPPAEKEPEKKTYRMKYTPAGELCTKQADEQGLLSREYRKFMVACLKEHQPRHPHQAAVNACFKENEPLRGGPEWKGAVKGCLDQVDIARKSDGDKSESDKKK